MYKKLKTATAVVVVINLIFWNFAAPLGLFFKVKEAQAAGVNADYAQTSYDILMNSTSTVYNVIKFEINDTSNGYFTGLTVNLIDANGDVAFSPADDLAALDATASSGMSLWKDNNGNGALDTGSDIRASAPSSWGANDIGWQSSFSGVDWQYAPGATLRLFLAFRADTDTLNILKKFKVVLRSGNMSFTGGTIYSWPPYYQEFPPVLIGSEGAGGYGSPIVISEIMSRGTNGEDEFVELYNRSNTSVDISDWSLKWNGPGAGNLDSWGQVLCDFDDATIMPGGSFFLAGYGGVGKAINKIFTSPPNTMQESGFIGLFSSSTLMDVAGYGSLSNWSLAEGGQPAPMLAASSSLERKASSDSTYTMMASGGVHQYKGNAQDSNNNAMDFVYRSIPEPQNAASPAESSNFDSSGDHVVINEVYYRTGAANGWLELFNPTAEIKNLSGYKLKHKGGSEYTFVGVTIASSSYLVVHWNQSGSNTVTDIYTDYIGMYLDYIGGDLILLDESSETVDYVQFGGRYANELTAVNDHKWTMYDYVQHPSFNYSIGRKSTNGSDSNSSSDWQGFASSSPGYPNMGTDTTAPATVANVTLSDIDEAEYGLNGRDVYVTWTPSATVDPSFARYEIFLLPYGTQIDYNNHKPIASVYNGQSASSYRGDYSIIKDSAFTTLADGSYVAYVLAFDSAGNKSGAALSASALLSASGGEIYTSGLDQIKPQIMHTGVWNAAVGSDLHIVARADDDRQISPTTPLQIVWKDGVDMAFNLSAGASTTNCVLLQSKTYDCIIPWDGSWNADKYIGYYLKAFDAADEPNKTLMSASMDADASGDEDLVEYHPFYIDLSAAPDDGGTDYDLVGTTYRYDGNLLASTTLIIEGRAIAPALTNASGTFAFSDNVLGEGMYNVRALRDGYFDMSQSAYRGNNINFYLNAGTYISSSYNTYAGSNPIVKWTSPFDNMLGAPRDLYCSNNCLSSSATETPIIIAFDRPMNAATINDQDASDAGSNIYLTTNGYTRASGKVYYDSALQQARFYSDSHDTLSLATYYNIVVTQGVTDTYGNPISGNNSDGTFSNGFTTIQAVISDYADYGDSGDKMPAYVMGMMPNPGQLSVPRSTSIVVKFSEPMDSATINSNSIKLYPVTNSSAWTLGSSVSATVTLDPVTRQIATLDPDGDLSNAYSWWELRVLGNARSSSGMYLADPALVGGITDNLNTIVAYKGNFQANTGAVDTTAPTIVGTHPGNNDGITNSNTVPVGIGALEIGFSEAMNPNTINGNNIILLNGSNVVGAKVSYDPAANGAKLMPYGALLSNSQYTLRVSAACADLSGNALSATGTVYFKTGSADTSAPQVMYANGDDYTIAITYNEPMNAAKELDTANWAYSVLNPANYAINGFSYQSCATAGGWSCGTDLIAPYNGATGTPLSGLGLSFSYEDYNNTVIIKGLAFATGTPAFQIFVDNVRDRSNNTISDTGKRASDNTHLNAARATLYNSTQTYGALTPGAVSATTDMAAIGMMKAGAFPANAMAGQQSLYYIDIPTTKSIPIGGKIIITFPAGFDVSAAAKDPYSNVNSDINEWNAGQVTIHSVTGNQSARTVAIVATTSATQVSDFLHMDIKGIVNSSIPKDNNTEGYTVDIKTFSADNALLETIYTMPFYISSAGQNSITGQINGLQGSDSGTIKLYLGSSATGPLETSVSVAASSTPDGTYQFNNLPNGQYYLYTDPTLAISGRDYAGLSSPDSIWLNGASTTRNIVLSPLSSSGAALTVSLTGDFSTGGIPDDVDVFASSPSGFRVKTLYDVGSVSGATTTLYLPAGDWMIGIGPAKPQNTIAQTVTMPDWMPPQNSYYRSDGTTSGAKSFSIAGQASYTISGTVTDANGTGIADAEVYAYQPAGSFGGSHTKTTASGAFSLKIPVAGTYTVGAFKPGLPEAKDKSVAVSANVAGVSLVLAKPAFTISGKVLNSAGNAVPYASVWAKQDNGYGHAYSSTDSAGNYILYVSTGTWRVEADAPGLGWMEYGRTITITDASAGNINIAPAAGTDYYTISGKVGVDSDGTYSTVETPFSNQPIRAVKYDSNGAYQGKEYNGITDSSGNYTISVPAGIYRVDIWTGDYGELGVNNQDGDNNLNEAGTDDDYADNPANVNAASGNVSNADIIMVQSGLFEISVAAANAPSGQEAFLKVEGVDFSSGMSKPTGFRLSRRINDISATSTVNLQAGDYFFYLDVPGYGSYIPDSADRHATKNDIVVSAARNVRFTLPSAAAEMSTISGTVYAGSAAGGNELASAWVWVSNPSNGYRNGAASAANGTFSLDVPAGTGYKISADKPGYLSPLPIDLDAGADVSGQNIVLAANSYAISGYIYSDSNSDADYDTGEAVPSGYVRAETTKCGDSAAAGTCQRAQAPVYASGYFQLGIGNGIWKLYGVADGYFETYYGSAITISGASASNKHIKLNANNDWSVRSKNKAMTLSSGGSLDDTDPTGTGIRLIIPPNALGSSNATGNLATRKTASVTRTNSSDPVGGTGVQISATDNDGQAITNLDDYVDVEMVLYKSDVDDGIASGTLSYGLLRTTVLGYWDDTTNDWVSLATARNAYYKPTATSTEWTLYDNAASSTPAFEAFINEIQAGTLSATDYKLVWSGKTDHFTIFAVIMPFVAATVEAAPTPDPDPAPVSPGGGGGGSYTSYCTSVSYGGWSECASGSQTREVTAKSPSGCRLTAQQEADKTRTCVLALNDTAEAEQEEEEEAVIAAPDINALYLEQAGMIYRAEISEILPAVGRARDHGAESSARTILISKLKINLSALEQRYQYALTNFIAYGSPDTLRLGAGERAGVVNSYRAAYGRLPESAQDWSDIIKISNGRWPSAINAKAESAAFDAFIKVYKRLPNRANPKDDAAIMLVAYGLRLANRNTASEAAAVKIFKSIYGYQPSNATDWDIVRAIGYSGAVREADTDKDLLSDSYEKILGTDPKSADTDKDGYSDGTEVRYGHNPKGK